MRFLSFILLAVACQSLSGVGLNFKFEDKKPVKEEVRPKVNISDPYLIENAKRPEVTVMPSGLQIEVFEEGYGRMANRSDTVVINYNGYLTDGTLFDSSYKRGTPATFSVGGVVPGFAEALMNIRLGGKAKVFIPSYLGYGSKGSGQAVPPNATIIFDIEVLDVQE